MHVSWVYKPYLKMSWETSWDMRKGLQVNGLQYALILKHCYHTNEFLSICHANLLLYDPHLQTSQETNLDVRKSPQVNELLYTFTIEHWLSGHRKFMYKVCTSLDCIILTSKIINKVASMWRTVCKMMVCIISLPLSTDHNASGVLIRNI